MNISREGSAVIFALLAVLLWSTAATAFKIALVNLEALDLMVLASIVSWFSLGCVLVLRAFGRLCRGDSGRIVLWGDLKGKSVLAAALLGLLNPLLYYAVLFSAYERLPAQVAQPLNYTWPLFLALLALPVLGRRPRRRDLLGILISMVGVVIISRLGSALDFGGSMDFGAVDAFGVLFALGSGVIWASYWLIGNRLKMDGVWRLFIGFSCALLPAIFIWVIRGMYLPGTLGAVAALVWIGLFEMGITFLFWNFALERTSRPARIGNLVYLGPFISLIWIAVILGESIRVQTVAGLMVIVLGILVGQGLIFGRWGEMEG